jgi:tetratricopeptide (TPR) repeat protein
MTRVAKMAGIGCLVGFVVLLFSCPAAAEATNKPSSPQAQERVLFFSECWDNHKPETFDNALRSFESVRTEYPGTLEAEIAYVEVLRIRWLKGDGPAVTADYTTWLAAEPSPVAQGHALRYFADDAAQGGDYAKAEALYKQAITLAGSHIAAGLAAVNLADLYLNRLSNPLEGKTLFEQTAKQFAGSPIEPEIRRRWANALDFFGANASPATQEEARAILQPTSDLPASSPLLPHAQYALAEALYLLAKPAEALAALEKACANLEPYRDQQWADAGLALMVALQQKFERWDDAIASARRYLQLFPTRDPAGMQLTIGRCCAAKGDQAQAIAEFEKVLAQYPDAKPQCAEALKNIGLAYRALGRHGDAAATFQRLADATQGNDRAFALFHLGQAQMALGDVRSAMATFQRVVDEYGASTYAAAARTEIENCRLTIELGGVK